MKKLLALTIVAGTATALASACAPKAISQETNAGTSSTAVASAFGLVHKGYYGVATVAISEGKISSVIIDETITKHVADGVIGANFREVSEVAANAAFNTSYTGSYNAIKLAAAATTAETTVCYAFVSDYDKAQVVPTLSLGTAKDTCATGTTALKTTAVNVSTKALKFATTDDKATIEALITTTAGSKQVINSKRESYGQPWAYWVADGGNGWMGNMNFIEAYFTGKTWNEIESNSYNTAANTVIAGATNSDRHHYAQLVKLAAKKAFGK